ncbi:polysaccharide deacetylase family protein [Clostridium sp. CS001]|uniref:polysaccharide deacetylase family protein n=1 Tax=Clostridium sp. CS001 TaxID=2880648 RepID=UPI001CF54823|nr:polysaccharide deacetylase family protein [Clostridium sp. CS001]MCB2289099.1 polysaccharide deacetylase family protein [Clostridium sp. CS001]
MNNSNKGRNISITVISLLCIVIFIGYFILKPYYTHNSVTENKNTLSTDKPKAVEIIKSEPQIKQEIPSNPKDTKPNTVVNDSNIKHNDKGIPIVMYHSIGYEKGNTARVTKEKFKEQMKYLKDNNYVTLTLSEAYDFFIDNKPVPKKSIVLTFDDGYVDNFVEALPILKEFKFKATIFVITSLVDKVPDYMNSSQLKEMQDNGIDIESHTENHEHLKELSYEKQVVTLQGSKDFLEKTLNKKIQYLAYPFGEYSKETLKAVSQVGYKMAITTDGRWSDKSDGILTLDRVFISGSANLNTFIERITNPNYKF